MLASRNVTTSHGTRGAHSTRDAPTHRSMAVNASAVGDPQKPISAATPGGASTAAGFRARIASIGVSTNAATTAEIANATPTSPRALAYCGAIAAARTDVENGTGHVSALHD